MTSTEQTKSFHVHSMLGAYVASHATEAEAAAHANRIEGFWIWDNGDDGQCHEFSTTFDQHQRLMAGC